MAEVGDFWKVRIPPPLWYAAAIVGGILLNLFVELDVDIGTVGRIVVPLVLVLVFVALAPRAIALFRRTDQDAKPWTPAKELLTSGPYRISRNPMYVGLASLQSAIGVALANGWILVLVPVVLLAVYATAIRFEEAYLRAQFGQAYTDYRRSVRRWL